MLTVALLLWSVLHRWLYKPPPKPVLKRIKSSSGSHSHRTSTSTTTMTSEETIGHHRRRSSSKTHARHYRIRLPIAQRRAKRHKQDHPMTQEPPPHLSD
ncbi:hypothetical protein J6590_012831 [Homalodisca vitripennis]|nr:hypothetical protein J6590_012831 [Homalodisca vitripennis]